MFQEAQEVQASLSMPQGAVSENKNMEVSVCTVPLVGSLLNVSFLAALLEPGPVGGSASLGAGPVFGPLFFSLLPGHEVSC